MCASGAFRGQHLPKTGLGIPKESCASSGGGQGVYRVEKGAEGVPGGGDSGRKGLEVGQEQTDWGTNDNLPSDFA